MIPTIEMKSDIDDAIAAFPKLLTSIQTAETLLNELNTMLSQGKWTGLARDYCVEINTLIKMYNEEIRGLCEESLTHLRGVKKDAILFCSRSKNVKVIKSI